MSRPCGPDQPQPNPMTRTRRLVDEQACGSVVVADQDVHVAVVVDVAKRRSATDL